MTKTRMVSDVFSDNVEVRSTDVNLCDRNAIRHCGIYTNFTTHIVDDTGIEQIDAYVAGPRANKSILRFERV